MLRIGRSAPWQPILGCRTPPSAGSGERSACNRTGPRRSSCPDPLFVDKVQDIVGLYMSPPNRAIVLCVDEKSQIQALDREQPVLPMAPGVPERRTHTYVRNGTTSLFAALDIATGAVIGKCYKRHRATEFLDFLKRIDAADARRAGRPPRDGQLCHPQDAQDQGLARPPPALACALHTDFGILDQSGRTVVCRVDAQATAARRPPIHR
jgi:hypothetical protein